MAFATQTVNPIHIFDRWLELIPQRHDFMLAAKQLLKCAGECRRKIVVEDYSHAVANDPSKATASLTTDAGIS